MARGFGELAKNKPCICENKSEWYVEHIRIIQKGKLFGKKVAIVCCRQCNGNWNTSAKYIENLPSIKEINAKNKNPN